jgi:peptidoglycan/LPS O-acetylase OafA/YrhL
VKDRLEVLDGLRGIAVLLVLWYHVWEISWLRAPFSWLQFVPETGFIGVHLFFFLSGFVITFPFVRAIAAGQPVPTWRHFYYRRFIKIVPSYLLSIAIAYLIGYAALVSNGAPVWRELLTHLLFIHTWWLDTYGAINGVLWTLAVEVEFYLIFPLLLFCFRRSAVATAAVMIALALAWRLWQAHCCFSTTYPAYSENLPGFLDIFAFGMLTAWAFARTGQRVRASRIKVAMPLVAIAGFVLLVQLLLGMFEMRTAPSWEQAGQLTTRVFYGLAFALIAYGSLCAPRAWEIVLANPPLRFLAFVSYNLYLYHQIVARELLRLHIPPYTGDPHYDPAWQFNYTIVCFIVAIAQAALFTYAFERPLLRLPEPRLVRASAGHTP